MPSTILSDNGVSSGSAGLKTTASKVCHLYRISDVARGKFYIGKHFGTEQKNYWGSGTRIKSHIKKYGRQEMKYEILVIADEQYILDLESRYVTDEFINDNPNCLNLCKGGLGGNLGGIPWNKGKAFMVPWNKGKTNLPPSWNSGKTGVQTAWNKGAPMSEKTKAKISASKKGTKLSDVTRARMTATRLGKAPYKMTDEVKAKISASLMGHTPWNKGKTFKEQ